MSSKSLKLLARAVRWRVVGKYIGQLWLVLAALTAVPLLAGIVEGEGQAVIRYAVVAAVLGGAGILLIRLPVPERIQTNEAMAVVALFFVLSPFLLAYPLAVEGIDYIDAWFEAVSGLTSTGLTTLATVEDKSRTFLLGRAWSQWYGGLGIAILSVALLLPRNLGERRLVESAGEGHLGTTARTHGLRVVRVYALLTVIVIAVLAVASDDWFEGLVHGLAAVSTGGFTAADNSLADVPRAVQVSVLVAIVLGAVCLPLYDRAWRKGMKELITDSEFRTLLLAAVIVAAIVWLSVTLDDATGRWTFGEVVFVAFSAQTTAGFTTADPATLPAAAKLSLVVSMVAGGSVGSTAGGIKLLRLLIMLRLLQLWLQRCTLPPEAVAQPKVGRHSVSADDVSQASALLLAFAGMIVAGWWILMAAGYVPIDALFEVVSATCTAGLSVGIAGPELTAPLKVVLGTLMLLGRVEIVALLILLYPRTWFARGSGTR